MRINYTMVGTGLTGGSRVILELSNKLVERGHDVSITSMGTEQDTRWFPLKAKVKYLGMTSELSLLFRRGYIWLNKRILNTVLDPWLLVDPITRALPDCDINIATYWFTAFSVYRSGKGRQFYHVQSYEPSCYTNAYHRKIVEESYFLPLKKIANSSWIKNTLQEKLGVNSAAVINPAIDHNVFFRRDIKKNTGKKRVVSLARPQFWKGFNETLDAMKIVMRKRNDVEFVVFGNKPFTVPGTPVPYKFITGPVNESLAEIYRSADVLVSGSYWESFPLPQLEAMACGTPVVTTRLGTEDYAIDNTNSFVIEPKNPLIMAERILELLENKALSDKFIEEGVKTAKRFTWDAAADKLEVAFK